MLNIPSSSAGKSKRTPLVPWQNAGCSEDPFRTSFDHRFIYLDADRADKFARLLQAIEEPTGLSLIVGPAGAGKTTLLRKLMEDLRGSHAQTFFFANPLPSLEAMLDACVTQAGLPQDEKSEAVDPIAACRKLMYVPGSDGRPVLLIDEAQALSDPMLDGLLAAAKPDENGRSPLAIVVAGDGSILQRLEERRSLGRMDTIGYSCRITPVAKTEAVAFIRHRLKAAGCSDIKPFARDAIELMVDYSKGIVGTLNTLCRLALFFAAERGENQITARSVELAASATLLSKEPLGVSHLAATEDQQADRRDEAKTAETRVAPTRPPPARPALGIWTTAAISAFLIGGGLLLFPLDLRRGTGAEAPAESVSRTTQLTNEGPSSTGDEAESPRPTEASASAVSESAKALAVPSEDNREAPSQAEADTSTREAEDPVADTPPINRQPAEESPEIKRLLILAADHVQADRLVAPRFGNALALYRKILRESPGNQEAIDGLAAIKAKLQAYAQEENERGDSSSARRHLGKIRAVDRVMESAISRWSEFSGDINVPAMPDPSVSASSR